MFVNAKRSESLHQKCWQWWYTGKNFICDVHLLWLSSAKLREWQTITVEDSRQSNCETSEGMTQQLLPTGKGNTTLLTDQDTYDHKIYFILDREWLHQTEARFYEVHWKAHQGETMDSNQNIAQHHNCMACPKIQSALYIGPNMLLPMRWPELFFYS